MNLSRCPYVRVLADGQQISGVIEAEVTSNNHYAADCYSLRIAPSADDSFGLSAWADAVDTLIEIQFSLAGAATSGDWTSLITGRIDSLEADPIQGELRIEGRDLSAGLIEARTHEAFANQTASDIATLLAARHGLLAQVIPTTTLIGRYYSNDHTRVTLDRLSRSSTEWDLLVFLAQQEEYDVFVLGITLYFQPALDIPVPAMVLQPVASTLGPANLVSLSLQRSMTLAADISVTVRSWNSQHQAAFSQTARRVAGSDRLRSYIYLRPNLTQDEALQIAQQKLAALTRHEYAISATMPGELTLAPRSAVQLVGTSSVFDQLYVIDSVTRRINLDEGFSQILRARSPSNIADFITNVIDSGDNDGGDDTGSLSSGV